MLEVNESKEFKKINNNTVKITKIEAYDYMTNYSFNVGLAQKYGVNESIILSNMIFWLKKNIANEKNFYDGYYWTYNSIKAFQILFPFWSDRQIRYILDSLTEKGIIKKGNYNKNKYDQANWYTIIDNSICQNCQIECTKVSNQNDKSVEPIPDINTDSKPVSKYDTIKKVYNDKLLNIYNQKEINDLIFNSDKETKQHSMLIKRFSEIDNAIMFFNIAFSDKWIVETGALPSLLNSQYEKIKAKCLIKKKQELKNDDVWKKQKERDEYMQREKERIESEKVDPEFEKEFQNRMSKLGIKDL